MCSDGCKACPGSPLGRALTLPRGTVGLRRKPQTPPLGTFSTAQDSRLSRIYLMEPEPFARGADGSFSRGKVRAARAPCLEGSWIEELGRRILQAMTAEEDIASVAGQLADLTRTVNQMNSQLKTLSERTDAQQVRANSQQDRTDVQQERIDLAARELAEVSDRLQAAANALRESI